MPPITYTAMELFGWSHDDAVENGYQPTMMSYDESYKLDESLRNNMNITDDQYKVLWNNELNKSLGVSNKKYDWDTIEKSKKNPLESQQIGESALPVSIISPERLGMNYDTKQLDPNLDQLDILELSQNKLFDHLGRYKRSMNDEEMAESNNYYVDMNGKQKSLNIYQQLDEYGERFRIDENGNKRLLKLDYELLTGKPYYKEVDATKFHKESSIRSYLGPKTKYSKAGALKHGYNNWVNTWYDQTLGATATVAEVLGKTYDWLSGNEDASDLTKWSAELKNFTGISKSKISEYDEKLGLFDGLKGFSGTAGNVMANITGAMTASRLMGVAGFGLTGSQNVANMLARGAGWTIGGGYAANRMDETARENGIDGWKKSALVLATATAVIGSEKFLNGIGLGGYIDNMFGPKTKESKLRELTTNTLRRIVGENADKIKNLPDKQATALINNIAINAQKEIYGKLGVLTQSASKLRNMVNMAKGAGVSVGNLLKKTPVLGRFMPVAGNAFTEGTQEVTEELFDSFIKQTYDVLESNFGNENSTVGNGLFGATLPSFDELNEVFWSGALGGSFSGLAQSLDPNYREQEISNHMISEIAAMHNTKEKADAYLYNSYKQVLDSPLLTVDNQLIASLPEEQRATAKSKNDILYESLQQQLDLAWETKTTMGLNDANVIAEKMGGDDALMKDALALSLDKDYYGKVYDDYVQRANQAQNDQEKEMLEQKAEKFKEILDQKSERLNYIMSGEMYTNYSTALHTKAYADRLAKDRDQKENVFNQLLENNQLTEEQVSEEKELYDNYLKQADERIDNANLRDLSHAYEMSNFIKNKGNELTEKFNEITEKEKDYQSKIDTSIDVELDSFLNRINTDGVDSRLLDEVRDTRVKATDSNGFTQEQSDKYNNILTNLKSAAREGLANEEDLNKLLKYQFDSVMNEEFVTPTISEDKKNYLLLPNAEEITDENNNKLYSDIAKIVDTGEIGADKDINVAYEAINTETGEVFNITQEQFENQQEFIDEKNKEQDTNLEVSDFDFIQSPNEFAYERYVDKDGKMIKSPDDKKFASIQTSPGYLLSEKQKELIDAVSEYDQDKTIINHLTKTYNDLYKQKIHPTIDLLRSFEDLHDKVEDRKLALNIIYAIKTYDDNGIYIDPKVKANLSYDLWSQVSTGELKNTISYLTNIQKNINSLINFINQNQNFRKQVESKYLKNTKKKI
jgi:hypothetical protein